MSPGRIAVIVIGVVLALPALGLLLGGAALTVGYATERDDGYFDVTLERLSTPTAAITTEEADLRADPGPPDWVLDFVDFSIRIQATGIDQGSALFIGIGPEADVEAYLSGVAHDEIRDVESDGDIKYRSIAGTASPAPPAEQGFWVASASGTGTQELIWEFSEGTWAAVLMNADASPGILAEVTVGIKSGALLVVAISMLVVGALLLAVAVTIIVLAARGHAEEPVHPEEEVGAEAAPPVSAEPVRMEASIDSPLSQWLWLVKWFLAIPHFILLIFLWIAFSLLTVISGVVILFTGRYPRGIFDFNVGVLRWTWRVLFYAGQGGLGTDRYPPFTTDRVDDYPATFDVEYPDELSRGLVLVKWWLLAIPHYLVLAFLVGGGAGWWWGDDWGSGTELWSGGLVALLVLIAAVILLFTGRYPRPLFDLIIGLNRWVFRVIAYAGLMTDSYPPFRLDQGGQEPRPLGELSNQDPDGT
ncbi:MAG: DUF4389 domain-containing protein [Acidobacteria bacterium]|nr:DUF4389 domain-containing protein [Acidobacteriota bacterium]